MFDNVIARVLLATAAALVASDAWGEGQYYWQAASGDWSSTADWGGILPTGSDAAYIANGGTVGVSQLGGTCGTLSLGGSAGSGTL